MTFSTLTIEEIKDFLRIDFDDDDAFLTLSLEGAKGYIRSYTNRTDEDLDAIPEVSLAVFALVSHFYDVRSFVCEEQEANLVIRNILGMHSFYYGE